METPEEVARDIVGHFDQTNPDLDQALLDFVSVRVRKFKDAELARLRAENASLLSELGRLRYDRDDLDQQHKRVWNEREQLRAEVERLMKERDEALQMGSDYGYGRAVKDLMPERDDWKRKAEEAEAVAGAMREALKAFMDGPNLTVRPENTDGFWELARARDALSSDTGKKAVAVLSAAKHFVEAASKIQPEDYVNFAHLKDAIHEMEQPVTKG